jgi:hypothetical protein
MRCNLIDMSRRANRFRFPPLGALAFYKDGKASFPYRSHGAWFVAQYVHFGLVKNPPDYRVVTDAILMQDPLPPFSKIVG